MIDPSELRFTPSHEWVLQRDHCLRVGITEYLQQQLSDIVSVDLPEPDDHHFEADEEACLIEAINDSADCKIPVPGVVTAVNSELLSSPELINESPYEDGWLFEMQPDDMNDIDDLMTIDEYESSLPAVPGDE